MSQLKALVDKLLTNVSQAYVPTGFVCEQVLTPLKSKQSSGKIGKMGMQHLRLLSTIMGGKGEAKRVEIRQYSSDSYFIEPHGLEEIITPEEYDNVEAPFDIESDVTTWLTTLLYIGKEKALADTLRSTSIITQNVTLSGTSQWNDYTNSDPINDINTAKKTVRTGSGGIVDTVILPYDVAEVLRYHPKILRNLGFADNRAGQLTDADLAKAFNVKRVIIPEVMYNASQPGQADNLIDVWGKDVIFMVAPTSAALKQLTCGYMVTKSSEGQRQVFKQPVINPPGAKSVICKDSYDIVITNVKAAYLIKTAIA